LDGKRRMEETTILVLDSEICECCGDVLGHFGICPTCGWEPLEYIADWDECEYIEEEDTYIYY